MKWVSPVAVDHIFLVEYSLPHPSAPGTPKPPLQVELCDKGKRILCSKVLRDDTTVARGTLRERSMSPRHAVIRNQESIS